jgi:hypothetical protein
MAPLDFYNSPRGGAFSHGLGSLSALLPFGL